LPRKKDISIDIIVAAWYDKERIRIYNKFVNIIYNSLNKEICSTDWKTSTILPIIKRKKGQYRPIVLPTFTKILKLMVKRQLDKYLENNDIITEHQSDFGKRYSCALALWDSFERTQFWNRRTDNYNESLDVDMRRRLSTVCWALFYYLIIDKLLSLLL